MGENQTNAFVNIVTIKDTPQNNITTGEEIMPDIEHTRRQFTQNIVLLILDMKAEGEQPILDFVKRSTEEQQRLFSQGRTKVGDVWVVTDKSKVVTYKDGITTISGHQTGKSADIYLFNEKTSKIDWEWDKAKAEKWHHIWELKYEGKPMLDFDPPHFEI